MNAPDDGPFDGLRFRDPEEAFILAIAEGRLSDNPAEATYCRLFMYMGTQPNGKDLFKHIWTREYLP